MITLRIVSPRTLTSKVIQAEFDPSGNSVGLARQVSQYLSEPLNIGCEVILEAHGHPLQYIREWLEGIPDAPGTLSFVWYGEVAKTVWYFLETKYRMKWVTGP